MAHIFFTTNGTHAAGADLAVDTDVVLITNLTDRAVTTTLTVPGTVTPSLPSGSYNNPSSVILNADTLAAGTDIDVKLNSKQSVAVLLTGAGNVSIGANASATTHTSAGITNQRIVYAVI